MGNIHNGAGLDASRVNDGEKHGQLLDEFRRRRIFVGVCEQVHVVEKDTTRPLYLHPDIAQYHQQGGLPIPQNFIEDDTVLKQALVINEIIRFLNLPYNECKGIHKEDTTANHVSLLRTPDRSKKHAHSQKKTFSQREENGVPHGHIILPYDDLHQMVR